jgi:hypothetical protein
MKAAVNPQLEAAMTKVLDNLKVVKYGDVSVVLKVHYGHVVSVIHSVTKTIREIQEERKMGP